MMFQIFVAFLLCTTHCAAAAIDDTGKVGDDEQNWKEVFKVMNASRMIKTDDGNIDLFETILRVNARERGTELLRSDKDVFLFEGDIVVNKSEVRGNVYPDASRQKRAVIRNTGVNLWSNPIYYVLDQSLGATAKSAIASAIGEWSESLPCLEWVNRTGKTRPRSYMHFFVGGGCYSHVGRVGGAQKVSIGRGCEHHGIAVHEIGHAIGLWHEQSRPDRDKYVRILWKNIIPGMLVARYVRCVLQPPEHSGDVIDNIVEIWLDALATKFNFQKQPKWRVHSLGIPYDYDSVMHYGAKSFAKARDLYTIQSLRTNRTKLGSRRGLSEKDKIQVKRLYNCRTEETTPLPTFTTWPWPTDCTDNTTHEQWCIESKNLSLCYNALFRSYMREHCCKTCNPTPAPTTPTTAQPTGCKDTQDFCKHWETKGYCLYNSEFYEYMMKSCCKSCKKKVPVCKDNHSKCGLWKGKNYCNATYVNYMKKTCPKTCGFC